MPNQNLSELAKFLRFQILTMTTRAGSGHPSSSLSATDLMTVLVSSHFRYDPKNPMYVGNDRLIFSKGHTTPLYFAIYRAAGVISESEIIHYRKFDSNLEGHPTPRFAHAEAATGSLGQGLSVAGGIALSLKSSFTPNGEEYKKSGPDRYPNVYVLLGDGEMAEGSVWEAMELISKYKLDNLVAFLDVNRLGQSDETMIGSDTETYKKRAESFGWEAVIVDGHNLEEIEKALVKNESIKGKPFMIIAKTIKGKGVPLIEDKSGWHGKPLDEVQLKDALLGLGDVDTNLSISFPEPSRLPIPEEKKLTPNPFERIIYKLGDSVATRKAYGESLAYLGSQDKDIVVLDADTKNSTYAEIFKKAHPERYFEMYIAEQNMVSMAAGLSRMGKKPFVSSFACFLTRTFDQIRMASLSKANIRFCGSHAGVSIGEDGPSQMGLEDLAMFRAVNGSTVLYPSDGPSTFKLVSAMTHINGVSYIRTNRPNTLVIYDENEQFIVGGSKVHRIKAVTTYEKKVIIVGAGVTLHEALKAQKDLVSKGIEAIVVDLYSVKPVDGKTLIELAKETDKIITVEDHWFDGGLGDAVLNVFAESDKKVKIYKIAVTQTPRSGKPAELLKYMGIDSEGIVRKASEIFGL